MSVPGHIASAEAGDAAERASHRRHRLPAPLVQQLIGFAVVFLFIFLLLALWGIAQNQEQSHPEVWLVGELAFLVLVIWWGLVVVSPALPRLTRRFPTALQIRPISTLQALVWAAGIVVAVPLAIEHGLLGVSVLGGVWALGAAALVRARRNSQRRLIHKAPMCLTFGIAALVLFPVAAWTEAGRMATGARAGPSDVLPAPTAQVLARRLRPMIFLDDKEPFPPVDIDQVTRGVCGAAGAGSCDGIGGVLDNLRRDYLDVLSGQIRTRRVDAPSTAIFHHVFREGKTVYVDYWWYFALNPAPVARNFFCGRALIRGMLGKGCAEHPADWEGMTLKLREGACGNPDPRFCVTHGRKTYEILQAQYAQHEKVVVYPWADLQRKWSEDARGWAKDAGPRPLVFVALNSHASYALPCSSATCFQIVHKPFTERRNGMEKWAGNLACKGCVKRIPTDRQGAPTGWNAVEGRWGGQNCILFGTYCDTRAAPEAPAYQPRYKDPCPAPGADHCLPAPKL
jgi:hypothetical protein